MTKEELQELFDKTTAEINSEFKEAQELWKRKKPISDKFLFSTNISSSDFSDYYTSKNMIDAMNDFNNDIKNLPYHINEDEYINLTVDDDQIYYEEYTYRYSIIKAQTQVDYMIKKSVKNKFQQILMPSSESYSKYVDCKLVELFKDGAIDFKTLQKLVYTNCDL